MEHSITNRIRVQVVRWHLTILAADALVHNSEHMHWLRPHCMCCVEHYELSRMT